MNEELKHMIEEQRKKTAEIASKSPHKYVMGCFTKINELVSISDCIVEGVSFVPGKNNIEKSDRNLNMNFSAVFSHELHEAYVRMMGELHLKQGESEYIIPKNCCNFDGALQIHSFEPQSFVLKIHKIFDKRMNADGKRFRRFILPINDGNDFWLHDFAGYTFVVGDGVNLHNEVLISTVDGNDFHFFMVKLGEHQYLIIDSLAPVTQREMHNVLYAFSLTMGLLHGRVYLDEVYSFEDNNPDFKNPYGIGYDSLRESLSPNYTIIATNKYAIIDSLKSKGLQYAIEELENAERFPEAFAYTMGRETYEPIIQCLYSNQDIARCVMILMDAANKPFDYQTSLYYIAFETICKALTTAFDSEIVKAVPDKNNWKAVSMQLQGLIDGMDDNIFSEEGKKILINKIANLNQPTNASSLSDNFARLGYKLTDADNEAIRLRNLLIHGRIIGSADDINATLDELTYLSLMVHKLCCILILRYCGYQGYIKNNPLIWGCKKSVENKESAIIRI